jgi:ABC-type nitrate/sulfonate/bicarbonate transport system ATPase subunit
MSDLGIGVKEIRFSYEERPVLANVSFPVPKAEIWALVGRSGVGKTTLLHVISGLFTPDSGSVMVPGRPHPGPGRVRGVVFQEESLLGWLTVEENLLFPNDKKPPESLRAEAAGLLEAVGLGERSAAYPNELSVGMRKRLEFARALLADPEYLLADEPFGTLDALTRRELWGLWRDMRQQRPRTGLLTTHDPEEAIRLCDVVVPLIGDAGATCGKAVQVPAEIRALAPGDHSQLLWDLSEQVVRALDAGAAL